MEIASIKIADCEPYGNSPSGEAAQMPAHGISKRGLGREVRCGLRRLVHRVSDAIQPSHPLSPPSPPTLNLSQHWSLFH